jgi:hypothetical protein
MGMRIGKRLDPVLLRGAWQGYQLKKGPKARPAPSVIKNLAFKFEWSLEFPDDDDGKAAKRKAPGLVEYLGSFVAPSEPNLFQLDIKSCDAMGGPYGRQQFKVAGSAKEGGKRYKVHGCFQQVRLLSSYYDSDLR